MILFRNTNIQMANMDQRTKSLFDNCTTRRDLIPLFFFFFSLPLGQVQRARKANSRNLQKDRASRKRISNDHHACRVSNSIKICGQNGSHRGRCVFLRLLFVSDDTYRVRLWSRSTDPFVSILWKQASRIRVEITWIRLHASFICFMFAIVLRKLMCLSVFIKEHDTPRRLKIGTLRPIEYWNCHKLTDSVTCSKEKQSEHETSAVLQVSSRFNPFSLPKFHSTTSGWIGNLTF